MKTRAGLFLAAAVAAQAQSVTTYTTLSSYSNATSNTTLVGFNNILPQGIPYQGFNPLSIGGVSFTTPTFQNVNTAGYYSSAAYPADYLLSTGTANGSATLVITLPTPALAVALDYGQFYGGNPATITLSNGFNYTAASPGLGSTAFVGFVSTTPISTITYTVSGGDYWTLLDLRISAPAPASGGVLPTIAMSFDHTLLSPGGKATLVWSSMNASGCTASGNWNGTMAASGSTTVTAPGTPGYYAYNLVCTGAGGSAVQSAVLTSSGATPSPSSTFTLASILLPQPNQITGVQTSLTVPPLPPVPSYGGAALFVWPGLEPGSNGANFQPIGNGVLQPVLSWGPSCAPTSQPRAYSSWWISGQYVNTMTSDSAYSGCYSGNSLLVSPGDLLTLNLSLDSSSGTWTETITDSSTSQTVTFNENLQQQGQNFLIFVIESYYGLEMATPAVFSSTMVTFQSPDYTGVCLAATGAGNNYVMTPPVSRSSGTQCFIGQIAVTQPFTPAQLSIVSSHSGSFTQGQEGATYTLTVSNASGAGETSGTVTVTETLPAGLTLVSMAGLGWSCSGNTCSRGDVLSSGSTYPPITVTVNVGLTAASPAVNQVGVAAGLSGTASGSDSTTIVSGQCSIVSNAANPVTDLQGILGQALGASAAANDLNSDGRVNVVDVQIMIAAALGLGCSAP